MNVIEAWISLHVWQFRADLDPSRNTSCTFGKHKVYKLNCYYNKEHGDMAGQFRLKAGMLKKIPRNVRERVEMLTTYDWYLKNIETFIHHDDIPGVAKKNGTQVNGLTL